MRGVRVAEFDLKERSLWVGYQKKGRRAEPGIVVDLQDVVAIQVVTGISANRSHNREVPMWTAEVIGLRADGGRIPLVQADAMGVVPHDHDAIFGMNAASQIADGLGVPLIENH